MQTLEAGQTVHMRIGKWLIEAMKEVNEIAGMS